MIKSLALIVLNIITFVLWIKGTISFLIACVLWVIIGGLSYWNLRYQLDKSYNPMNELAKYKARVAAMHSVK